jgi:hypothetical protein
MFSGKSVLIYQRSAPGNHEITSVNVRVLSVNDEPETRIMKKTVYLFSKRWGKAKDE